MAFKMNLLPLRGLNYRLNALSEIVNINSITPVLSAFRISKGGFSTSSISNANKNSNNVPLFIPLPMKPSNNLDDINVGEELTGKLKKDELLKILNTFCRRPQIFKISEENGLDTRLFNQAFASFRRYCVESESLPPDLHVTCSDILQGAGHPDDLLPYFMNHARQIFPHLQCMEDLKKISDLRLPTNWYPEARAINRKIIFHAGPTNSGKTYHALERFMSAKTGVYCGPLKLLASEVFSKCNEAGTLCDLVTGEERRFANADRIAASHVSCTVEMASVTTPYEVAVIDEIQMIRDIGRGWAWTRALLGVAANEIHLCGEPAAIDLIKEICLQIGETVEIRKYKRLTQLAVQDNALESLNNVEPGDCIVCFSKNDIYNVSRQIEKLHKNVAVIYGGLPPGTKLGQAKKFNDPNDQCKILVATDAIGMGLNLSIRRIIFYSLIKPTINEKGEKEMDTISTSQALQIAGRAGRYGTQFEEGFVTTFKKNDLTKLKMIMNRSIDDIEAAGLHPTAEQIEMFAYHLPHATLSNLIDIFVSLCEVDHSRYFMCNVDDFKFLADMIQHVPLPLRARYCFCCAPINRKMPFICTMFLKFARQYSRNELITLDWLCQNLSWPFALPQTIVELVHLETVFDILDLYLWLSYRFQDFFPDAELVRAMQVELDEIIQIGVGNITTLLRNSQSGLTTTVAASNDDDEPFIMKHKMETYKKDHASSHITDNLNDDEEETEINQQKHLNFIQKKSRSSNHFSSFGRGKLSKRLISDGLLTESMMKELRREWEDNNMRGSVKFNDDSSTNYTNNSTKKNK